MATDSSEKQLVSFEASPAAKIAAARAEIAAAIAADPTTHPEPCLRGFAGVVDELIATLFAQSSGPNMCLAVVALGGYGRQELFPYSDVDLLIVHQHLDAAAVESVVERVVYPLWDAKLAVGHAVRDVDETLDLAREDLTMRTSLLDARLVVGDAGPFHALQAGASRELFGPDRLAAFRELLVAERAQRHERFGQTVFLLEPHIKSGMGGLRDINTALWAAKARRGVSSLADLSSVELATTRQQQKLVDAVEFLQRLRLVAHLQTGRAQDRLLFELQETLAAQLVPDPEIPGAEARKIVSAVAPAVERLMRAYYRAARTVVLESEAILERCFPPVVTAPVARPIERHFQARGGRLETAAPEELWERPADLLRAVELADCHDLRLDRGLRDAIEEAAAGAPGAQLPADGEAAELLLRLLVARQRPDVRPALEELHQLGILVAILPEFSACMGRVQHDLYHVFTVDRHSLYVVELLKEWIAGRRSDVSERGVEVTAQLEDYVTLLLGALLHDIGKPFGSQHAEKGARLAAGIAARLGLSAEQVEEVVYLVREHLVMTHLSQRRDLSDTALIAGFAEGVGKVGRLRRLYLLALADSAMTAPGNLGEWKASLLDELYRRAEQHLRRGASGDQAEAQRLRTALAAQLAERAGAPLAEVEAFVARLPRAFFSSGDVAELAHHAGVAWDMMQVDAALLRVGFRENDDSTVAVTICCVDRPGLLATITGVMWLERLSVLGARVYTLPHSAPNTATSGPAHLDGGTTGRETYARPVTLQPSRSGAGAARQAGLVLDIFWVPAPRGGERAMRSFSQSLHQALNGELPLAARLAERVQQGGGLGRRVVPRVETRVSISNSASKRATVIDIQTADRQGLLHVVTRTLSDLQLEISVARVATEAGKVIDSFYVCDRHSGEKLQDSRRLATVRAALIGAVEALPEQSVSVEQQTEVQRPSSTAFGRNDDR